MDSTDRGLLEVMIQQALRNERERLAGVLRAWMSQEKLSAGGSELMKKGIENLAELVERG